jgi:hypothetical protein
MAGELGIDQFLDLGSGLPAADNVHEVAQRENPAARVVYLDNDPIVLAHGRALLEENEYTTVLQADVREPGDVLARDEVRGQLDFSRPIGVIANAVLHHMLDEEDPLGVIAAFRDAVADGSYVFVSHFRSLGDPESTTLEETMRAAFDRGTWRTDEQIAQYFEGTTLVDPGIVPCALWRPDKDPGELSVYQRLIVAGLGKK